VCLYLFEGYCFALSFFAIVFLCNGNYSQDEEEEGFESQQWSYNYNHL
jgi:hypothetical protein